MSALQRLRDFGADALMLYALPACVALLPWRAGFFLLRRVARIDSLYRLAVDPAWQVAREVDPLQDENLWKQHFRLLRLVDHVDVYLALLRRARWRERFIRVTGAWPTPGACVILTCHWGAGGFIWPILREHGMPAHFLMQRPQGRSHGLTRLSHWFTRWRVHGAMRGAGGLGALYTGGSGTQIAAALRAGHSVVGMLDLPPRDGQQALEVDTRLGMLRLPVGLVRLALAQGVPVLMFRFALDMQSGARTLHVHACPPQAALETVMRDYAHLFDACLGESPESWHLWRELPGMRAATAQRADVSDSKTQGIQ